MTMVTISLAVCLLFLKSPGSVGVGTAAAAVLVGTVLGVLTKKYGKYRAWLLQD